MDRIVGMTRIRAEVLDFVEGQNGEGVLPGARAISFSCSLSLSTTYHVLNWLVKEGLLKCTRNTEYRFARNDILRWYSEEKLDTDAYRKRVK